MGKKKNLRNQFVDDSKNKKIALVLYNPQHGFFGMFLLQSKASNLSPIHYQLYIKLEKEKKTNKRKEPTKLGLSPFVFFLFFHFMDFLSFFLYSKGQKKKQDEDTIIRSSNCFVCIVTFFYT